MNTDNAAQVPAGFALVPLEPTEAMFTRFSQQIETGVVYVGGFLQAYRCMLDAAPEPTAGAAQVPSAHEKTLKDIRWRLDDIRDMLMTEGHNGRIYGCDEWSTPTVNLATAIRVIDAALSQPCQQGDAK